MPSRCSWSSPILPSLEVSVGLALVQDQKDMNLLWLSKLVPLSEVHRLKSCQESSELPCVTAMVCKYSVGAEVFRRQLVPHRKKQKWEHLFFVLALFS